MQPETDSSLRIEKQEFEATEPTAHEWDVAFQGTVAVRSAIALTRDEAIQRASYNFPANVEIDRWTPVRCD